MNAVPDAVKDDDPLVANLGTQPFLRHRHIKFEWSMPNGGS